jgi:serine protease Do
MRKSFMAVFAVSYWLWAISTVQAADLPDFKTIVKQNTPAVVKILVEYSSGGSAQRDANPLDNQEIPEYLRRFFEFRGAPPRQRQRQSMGSGFIISRDGYVVTNNHVVEDADSILVRLTDRREYAAEVVGQDPRSDLALLRVDAEDLPVLKLGEPGELEVGEWVLAIGSPFGLDYSVTAGIVSAKGRSLPTESNENYVPFIQTDVAINPGNSGGPLFNLDGELVGVNSQIFTRSGGSIGLSFAIPVSVVINVVEQLRETGHVTRGWLGVTIQNVDKNLAESFGLDRPRGALISQLQAGGPAEKGGLQPGDVILRFDGAEIHTSADLPHVVGLTRPGSRVTVEVMREGKTKSLKMKVGGLDADEEPSILADSDVERGGGKLGLVVEEINDQLQSRWGISGGVVVSEVVPQGAGDRAGLIRGDVITLIGSTPVSSVAAYTRAVEQLATGKSVPMRIIRRGAPLFIGLKLD